MSNSAISYGLNMRQALNEAVKEDIRSTIRYNTDSLDYENYFIPEPILRPKYGTLFDHQGFLLQRLHRLYLSVTLALPK